MKINLGTLSCLNFTLLTFFAGAEQAQEMGKEKNKPNVLFIAVDDLKPILGCYGNTQIKTPNIDRIASRGTVFLNNHCQQAVCAPTRASLLTGKRPDYTRVWDLKTLIRDMNPEILTLPQYLREQGYITTGISKVFDNRSVDSFYDKPSWSIPSKWVDKKYYSNEFGMPSNNYYHLPETKRLINQYLKEAGEKGITGNAAIEYARSFINPSVECMEIPDNAYADGATALEAKDIMIQLSKKNEPFFFAVGFLKPHLPFVSPKKYWDLYQRDDLPVSEHQQPSINGPLIAYHNSSESWTYTDILALLPKIKPTYGIGLPIEKQKELIHGYYAAVSYTDAQVGKLLNALDSLGLGDNTIIVLWGDHGWHLGDHDMWCKHSNFEQATRSPLIIAAPGIKPSKTKSVSEFVDIFPTLCDLTGIEIPAKLDGVSLVPLMKTPSLTVKEFAVSQYTRGANVMGYSIRTDRYRYTIWIDHNFRSTMPFNPDWLVGTELYDYTVDPEETVNVNNEEIYASVSKELNKQMMQFLNSQVKDNGTTRVYDNKDNPVTRHIFQDTNSEIINLSYTSVNNGKVLVKIMTLNSNVVKTFNSTKTDKRFESQINIADLNTGIYLIEVQENGVRLFCDKIVRL